MHKLSIILTSLILVSTIPLAYSGNVLRHVDPAKIEEDPSASALGVLAFHSDLIDHLAQERWVEASREIEIAPLSYIPPAITSISNRINGLLGDLTVSLSDAKRDIDDANGFIERGMWIEAEIKLGQASRHLIDADRQMLLLESTMDELRRKIGFELDPVTRALERVESLRNLLESYRILYLNLEERIRIAKESRKEDLSIQIDRDTVELGSWVEVDGMLLSAGKGLAKRTIDFYMNDVKIGQTHTNSEGRYQHRLRIPHVYQNTSILYAFFNTTGGDITRYEKTISNILSIRLLWDPATLEINAPIKVYPGRKFDVEGSLHFKGQPLQGFQVNLTFIGKRAVMLTGIDGFFKTVFTVPPNVVTGLYPLNVSSLPVGIVGPTSKILYVTIERLPLTFIVDAPRIVVAGFPMVFKGRAFVRDIPQGDSPVNIVLEWEKMDVVCDENGFFEARFEVPLTLFTYFYAYTVSSRGESWLEVHPNSGSLIVINPFISLATLFFGIYAVRSFQHKRKRTSALEGIDAGLDVAPKSEREGRIEGLAGIYWKSVKIISSLSGISPLRSHTLREYLRLIKEKIKGLYKYFRSVTLIYERYLYGPGISQQEERKAKGDLRRMER